MNPEEQKQTSKQQTSKQQQTMRQQQTIYVMSLLATICSVLAMFASTTIVFGVILGSFAIILAVLAKGQNQKMSRSLRNSFTLGIIAICISMILFGFSMYTINHDPVYRQQFNEIYQELYGTSYDDALKQLGY